MICTRCKKTKYDRTVGSMLGHLCDHCLQEALTTAKMLTYYAARFFADFNCHPKTIEEFGPYVLNQTSQTPKQPKETQPNRDSAKSLDPHMLPLIFPHSETE